MKIMPGAGPACPESAEVSNGRGSPHPNGTLGEAHFIAEFSPAT
jgi:hypothetical protein